jgi:beta-ureidopropionase / N-carbamoyl-L-amino-acid hydrolase
VTGLRDVSINGDRLWADLMALAEIGATSGGGVCRLALSEEDRLGRAWFVETSEAMGLRTRTDAIGNLFARLEGEDPTLPTVLVGSHLDTQPSGGKFDGTYGVLAGLEVARTILEAGIAVPRALEIVSWTNEEGSRFLPVMAGSGVYAGVHTTDSVLAMTDQAGIRFGDALTAIHGQGHDLPRPTLDSYFEAHIEQGPVLEANGETIGVVTGALGQRWFECTLTGFEAHAGPTPMNLRRDALQGAAAIIAALDQIGRRDSDARSTVGMIECWPNSRNTIPGRVVFSIDLRHPADDGLSAMESEIRSAVERIAAERRLTWALRPTNDWPACQFDADCVDVVAQATEGRGYRHRRMVSGAGHDAVNLARVAPTAMIFVPCRDGVSHNETEDAMPDDLTAGANVLLDAVLARMGHTLIKEIAP